MTRYERDMMRRRHAGTGLPVLPPIPTVPASPASPDAHRTHLCEVCGHHETAINPLVECSNTNPPHKACREHISSDDGLCWECKLSK